MAIKTLVRNQFRTAALKSLAARTPRMLLLATASSPAAAGEIGAPPCCCWVVTAVCQLFSATQGPHVRSGTRRLRRATPRGLTSNTSRSSLMWISPRGYPWRTWMCGGTVRRVSGGGMGGGVAGGDLHREEDLLGTSSYPPRGIAFMPDYPRGKCIRVDVPVLIYTDHTGGE